jgi:hypothetical protein
MFRTKEFEKIRAWTRSDCDRDKMRAKWINNSSILTTYAYGDLSEYTLLEKRIQFTILPQMNSVEWSSEALTFQMTKITPIAGLTPALF